VIITENRNEFIKQKLKEGIVPAVPIPFNKTGNIDKEAQEKYIQYMKSQPVAGFAVWAHTGRGLQINEGQRTYIMNSWRQAFPDKLIIAGVGANLKECRKSPDPEAEYLKRSIEMAYKAKELNADAIMVYAPVIFRDDKKVDEKVIQYHKEIAKVGLPLILFYLYEQAGGITYSSKVLNELLKLEAVLGIKMATLDSVMTYQDVSRLIQDKFPQKIFITGEDRMFGYTLMRGAQAALVGIGSACTALQKSMMDAYYNRNFDKFIELSKKVDELAECTFVYPMEGYIKRMLVILSLLGVIPIEATYDPFGPITELEDTEINEIKLVLQKLGQL
jgi:4-hydroxy-tetrahydrodipicolinate synthase